MNADTVNPHRRQYRVWLVDHDQPTDPADDAPPLQPCQVVTVTYADQLRGELEGRKLGLGHLSDTPMHYATVWVWAALVRSGRYGGKFQEFKGHDLGELEPVIDPDDETPGEDDTPDPS